MKKLCIILLTLFTFVSCNQKPSSLLGENITDLKNRGICERVIGGHPSVWSLLDNSFKNVSFDKAQIAFNKDGIVDGIRYEKNKISWPSVVSKSDKENFQREFNYLDRYFSNLYNEEGEYKTLNIDTGSRVYISWNRDDYIVELCTDIPKENSYSISLILEIKASSFSNPFIWFLGAVK